MISCTRRSLKRRITHTLRRAAARMLLNAESSRVVGNATRDAGQHRSTESAACQQHKKNEPLPQSNKRKLIHLTNQVVHRTKHGHTSLHCRFCEGGNRDQHI